MSKDRYLARVAKKISVLILIQAFLCLDPVFAATLKPTVFTPEHCLAPQIAIDRTAFSHLIEQAYSQAKDINGRDPIEGEIDLLSEQYQLQKRKELIRDIISAYKINSSQQPKDLEILKKFIEIAEEIYENKKFVSGEFLFNHDLEAALFTADYGGTLEEIFLAIVHNMDKAQYVRLKNGLNSFIMAGVEGKNKRAKTKAAQIMGRIAGEDLDELFYRYGRMLNQRFQVHSKGVNSAENYMNAMIKMTKGDPRLMRVFLADKRASISTQSERGDEQFIQEIELVIAPLAGRFGLKELEAEFFDETFRLKEPEAYAWVEDAVRKSFGRSYKELEMYLADMAQKFKKLAESRGITVEVRSRLKNHFGIYHKEMRLRQLRGEQETLHLEDLMGIRIICKNREDLYNFIAEAENCLFEGRLGDWRPAPEGYDHKKDSQGNFIDMVYLDIQNKSMNESGSALIEIQFITEALHNYRETFAPHWAYAAKKRTGGKQRFEKAEPPMIFSEDQNFDPWEQFNDYFRQIYKTDAIQKWVFVFERTQEDDIDVIKPKRMQKGGNGPVFAAQRGIDKFNADYMGVTFWEWKQGKLVPLSRQKRQLEPLDDGDIVSVKNTAETGRRGALTSAFYLDKGYRAKIAASIRGFLRASILLSSLDLDPRIEESYLKNARLFLKNEFSREGVNLSPESLNLKSKYFNQFLDTFVEEKRLMNTHELYLGLGLQLVDAAELVLWAGQRGEDILSKEFDISDQGIKTQLENLFGNFNVLCIEVGLGRKKISAVQKALQQKENMNLTVSPTLQGKQGGTFKYRIDFQKSVKQGRILGQLVRLLQEQGIDIAREDITVRTKGKGVQVIFQIPLKYEQLPQVREALTDNFRDINNVRESERRDDIKDNLIKVGMEIALSDKEMMQNVVRKFSSLGDLALAECFLDEGEHKIRCVVQVDSRIFDQRRILQNLGLSADKVKFVSAKSILDLKAREKQDYIIKLRAVESSI